MAESHVMSAQEGVGWTVRFGHRDGWATIEDAKGEAVVCFAPSRPDHKEIARLIAAAPETKEQRDALLNAAVRHIAARDALADVSLASLSKDDPRFAAVTDTLEELKAAIQKAGGQHG